MNRQIAIFDLDGCISDDTERKKFLPDYAEYHDRLDQDPVMNHMLVIGQHELGREIVFLTARPETYRVQTLKWLYKAFGDDLVDQCRLLMRDNSDHRKSPAMKLHRLITEGIACEEIVIAYDDRVDVLAAYKTYGIKKCRILDADGARKFSLKKEVKPIPSGKVPTILREMASTYEERNAVYGNNYELVTQVLNVLFPDGVPKEIYGTYAHNLLEMVVGKITRFVKSGLKHKDSIHDAAVYCAIIESTLED